MRRDVFQAIADPTRRQIIHILAYGSLNLNAVAGNFRVSRPAISRHVRILAECGLIEIRRNGRERLCEANLQRLAEVADWVDTYRAFWTRKLDAFETFLDTASVPPKKSKTVKSKKG